MKKYISPYSFSVLVGAVVVALLAGWYAFAFTPPTTTPPGCPAGTPGCDAPINVSSNAQTKAGDLDITVGALPFDALLTVDRLDVNPGNATFGGNVGIGTTLPAAKLHVSGGASSVVSLLQSDGASTFIIGGQSTLPVNERFYYMSVDGSWFNFGAITDDFGTKTPVLSLRRAGGAIVTGVGDTSPDADFEVVDALFVSSDASEPANGNLLRVTGTGAVPRVGIGMPTSQPIQSALQVKGYVQLDTTSGAPPPADCDAASEEGRMKFDPDSAPNILYICSGASSWVAFTP